MTHPQHADRTHLDDGHPNPPFPAAQVPQPRFHRSAAHRNPHARRRWAAAGGAAALSLALAGGSIVLTSPVVGASTSHHVVMVKKTSNPNHGTILVATNGFTLYRLTHDTPNHSTCTGSCASIWPPLLLPKGDKKAAGASGISGVSQIKLPNGRWQVTYHKMPLYRFSGDQSKGSTAGQGIGGIWFVVHPSSSASTTANSGSSSGSNGSTGSQGGSSGSGGYGGY
jgi:predicted lipoprotein with Yx(FWY)xxD motif